jgi:hypothetical protein
MPVTTTMTNRTKKSVESRHALRMNAETATPASADGRNEPNDVGPVKIRRMLVRVRSACNMSDAVYERQKRRL